MPACREGGEKEGDVTFSKGKKREKKKGSPLRPGECRSRHVRRVLLRGKGSKIEEADGKKGGTGFEKVIYGYGRMRKSRPSSA